MSLLPLRWRPRIRIGRGASVAGRIWVHGNGTVTIGEGARLDGRVAPIELHAGDGAEIVIGAGAVVEAGASIEAQASVTIGDRCRIGAYSKIMDNHFHPLQGDRHQRPLSDAVVIEDGVELGRRAIVLPGAQVRAGTTVAPGAVVRAPPRARRAASARTGS